MIKPNSEDIFNFPCDYPIKVFGKECADFKPTICTIIEKYTDALNPNQISVKRSSKGNYSSLTVRIIATSRVQLDALNQELQDCHLVAYLL